MKFYKSNLLGKLTGSGLGDIQAGVPSMHLADILDERGLPTAHIKPQQVPVKPPPEEPKKTDNDK